MRNISLVLLTVLASSLASKLPIYNIKSMRPPNGRIVGGTTAAAGDFPYQATLRLYSNAFFCGGSVVSDRWIITASHCVTDKTADDFFVNLGEQTLSSGGTFKAVTQVVPHDGYGTDPDTGVVYNDIAMVKTTYAIVYTDYIQPIGVGTGTDVDVSVAAVISGFGYTSDEGSPSNDLQYLNVTTVPRADCFNQLSWVNAPDYLICAIGASGTGTCSGDSGGPLVSNGELIGVVSGGIPPCGGGFPDIYTRVSSFYDWITANLAT